MLTKFVCRECMAVERTASYEDFVQVGPPAPWNDDDRKDAVNDEKLWGKGEIHCPHLRREIPFTNALVDCLKGRVHRAVRSGALVVLDERELV